MNAAATPRTVLITGASRGIGAATALLAAQRGWDVLVNYTRDTAAAEQVADGVRALGRRAALLRADVAVEAQVLAMFAAIDDLVAQGWAPLSGLVNNAGVVDVAARVADMAGARIERLFAVNVFGSMWCAREAVRRMSSRYGGNDGDGGRNHVNNGANTGGNKGGNNNGGNNNGNKGGAIVNLSSVAAVLGAPGQYVDYAATKGAIDVFTLGLAREVAAEGVRVNAVRPGIIDTDIHASGGEPDRAARLAPIVPMQRAGTAAEVANAIVWLLSDEASYATGTFIDVSGGR